ncbi:hypothetical protein DFH27DRAFT_546234 [Peziza echinospora]|nr:hypothetical protein DFH27DRAFT_546234 [Peziza echinospora]
MSGRKSRRSHPPLEQTRLADVNFNFRTVTPNSRRNPPPPPEKQKQVGLDAFGFSLKPAGKPSEPAKKVVSNSSSSKKVPKTEPEEDEAPPSKRYKVNRPQDSSPPRRLARFPQKEVAETQFAYPGSLSEDDSDEDEEMGEKEGSGATSLDFEKTPPPAEHPPTPTSVIGLPKLDMRLMPPPMTPKRRRILEIPSSHSPPVTPLSPYRPSPQTSPLKSPLSRRRVLFRTPTLSPTRSVRKKVESSQWWENEDSQQESVLSTQVADEEKLEGDISSNSFRHGPLFPTSSSQSAKATHSNSRSHEAPSERQNSPIIKSEFRYSTTEIFPPIDSPPSRKSHSPMFESPQIRIKRERENVQHVQYVKRELSVESSPGLFSFPEQSLMEQDGNSISEPPSKDAQTRNAAEPSVQTKQHFQSEIDAKPASGMQQAQETQYDCTAEYSWWDLTPGLTKGNGVKEDSEAKRKHSLDLGPRDDDGADLDGSITMSQLLPSSLMESFPMPPPLTQWSGNQSGSLISPESDDDDDDEL